MARLLAVAPGLRGRIGFSAWRRLRSSYRFQAEDISVSKSAVEVSGTASLDLSDVRCST
jgi:hypothetical protein